MELVTIKLDKERHLRLTLKGMLEFEKLTGHKILEGLNVKDFTLQDLGTFIWACLIHEDKELKLDDVLYMIDVENMNALKNAVYESIASAYPEVKESESPLVEKPQTG